MEIVLLRRKVDMIGKTFSSSFVRDCRYNLRSSSDSTLPSYPNVKPKATLGERAFLFAAPKLWNVLPRYIRESISIDTFKRVLKTHLFKKHFVPLRL